MAVPKKKSASEAFSVLTPSGLGAVAYTTIAALLLFLYQFKEIEQYLQVPGNFHLGAFIMKWLDIVLTSAIGEERTQTLVVGTFWAFVGLGVYVLLHGIARFIIEMGEGLDQRKFVWPKGTNRYRPLLEAAEKGVFRFIALIALIMVVLGPLATVLSGPVWQEFLEPSKPLQLLVWFGTVWLMLHAAIVLARLVALRARLFG